MPYNRQVQNKANSARCTCIVQYSIVPVLLRQETCELANFATPRNPFYGANAFECLQYKTTSICGQESSKEEEKEPWVMIAAAELGVSFCSATRLTTDVLWWLKKEKLEPPVCCYMMLQGMLLLCS